MLGIYFMLLLSSADFFQNKLFLNILSETLSEFQTVWIQNRTVLSVQPVWNGYQLATKVADLNCAFALRNKKRSAKNIVSLNA